MVCQSQHSCKEVNANSGTLCSILPYGTLFGVTAFPASHLSPLLTLPPPSTHTHKHSQEMSQEYWPTQPNAKQLYGKNSVELLSEEHSLGAKEIVVRKFDITDEKVCLHCVCRPPSQHGCIYIHSSHVAGVCVCGQ